ncbi:MAG: hypothetical protein BEN19_03305 [Epulopiscium sp. Nuni2H_MBin003]|nr:MAG: hypothetical protein BEN19_03305 [Epulopiscium sp. Nuni2H_MBin003]
MKIFHTSDWHIGKIVNNYSMISDQTYILDKFIDLVEEEKPDAIIIAGDLYDRPIPHKLAVKLLNNTLTELVINKKIPVFAISGNHDSGARVGFGSDILRKAGLYIAGDTLYDKIELSKNNKSFHFYLVPYTEPTIFRSKYNDIKTHQDCMEFIVNKIKTNMNPLATNILVGHAYVSKIGSDTVIKSESEKPLSIGDAEVIDYSIFNDFDYVALGHLHGRQYVGRPEIRYSGSLLKYSFSEVTQIKGINKVEINGKDVQVTYMELKPKKDFKIIKGTLEELTQQARAAENKTGKQNKDYIHAILMDEEELINPIMALRKLYPNIMSLEKIRDNKEFNLNTDRDYKIKSPVQLFEEFYNSHTNYIYTLKKQQYVTDVIEEVQRGEL